MKLYRLISAFVVAVLLSAPVFAAPEGEKVRIDYRPRNYNFDATYKSNAETVRGLYDTIEKIGTDNIDHVHIVASAVPGSADGLAQSRSVDAKWIVLKKFPALIGHVVFVEGDEGKDAAWISIVRKAQKDNAKAQPAAEKQPEVKPEPAKPAPETQKTTEAVKEEPAAEQLIEIKPVSIPGSAAAICAIEAHIDYRFDNFNYDSTYLKNKAVIEALYYEIDKVGIESIDSVSVVSYASPEGAYEHNMFLAKSRAIDSKWIILKKYPSLIGRVSYKGQGESWDDLRAYIAADTKLRPENVRKLLSILDDKSISLEKRKAKMKTAGEDANVGDIYTYLIRKYYRIIRGSTIISFYLKPQEPVPAPVVREVKIVEEQPAPALDEPVVALPSAFLPTLPKKETVVAVKTNLLYDVLTMANVEVEVPLGKRFSLMVEDVFPWWEFSKNKYALQNWEMGAEFRFWFKPWAHDTKKLKGWFVGPYAMSGKGDLQFDTQLCYQFTYASAGLSTGWVLPLGRTDTPWGRLEFSLSVGYLLAHYQHYQPSATYDSLVKDADKVGSVTWLGPTKAKISLVIPLNFTTKKANDEQ